MKTDRKLQLSAAAVIGSGLMALLAPAAQAGSCQPFTICNACETLTECQAAAPPGCTATGLTCANFCPGERIGTICYYD
jgi:hypothetical protein